MDAVTSDGTKCYNRYLTDWKPVKRVVRFVLMEINERCCILMSSDTDLSPEEIIRLYTCRFKIGRFLFEVRN
jgi:hypothetical protein